MLSIYDSKEVLGQVVDSGAGGFVLKSDARDLIAAVEALTRMEHFSRLKQPKSFSTVS